MEFFGEDEVTSDVFKDAIVVMPSLSFANMGQLVVDILVNSALVQNTNVKRVGHLFSSRVSPMAGGAAFSSQSTADLCLNMEVYLLTYQLPQLATMQKVAFIQQRTSILPGQTNAFVKEFVEWTVKVKASFIVMLAGADNMLCYDNTTMNRVKWTGQNVQFNQSFLEMIPRLQQNEDGEWDGTRGAGLAPLVDAEATRRKKGCLSFILYCAEGNNVPDAVYLASCVTQYLLLATTMHKLVAPPSWSHLFGRDPSVALFFTFYNQFHSMDATSPATEQIVAQEIKTISTIEKQSAKTKEQKSVHFVDFNESPENTITTQSKTKTKTNSNALPWLEKVYRKTKRKSQHVVAIQCPESIEILLDRESTYKQPPMNPLLWKEKLLLGWKGCKRIEQLRENKSPLVFTFNDSINRPLQITLGLSYNTNIIEIKMTNNTLAANDAIILFRALRTNPSMTTLDVSYNQLNDDSMAALGVTLGANKTLTQLNLNHNKITERGVACLTRGLQDNLDSLLLDWDLSYNPLLESSTKSLMDCLSVNETLINLNLTATYVDEALLLSSLRRNCTLFRLDVAQLESPILRNQSASGRLEKDHLTLDHAPQVIEALRRATSAFNYCDLTGVLLPIATIKSSRWIKLPDFHLNELDGLIIAGLLPLNHALMELDLSNNALGSESVAAIMYAILSCPALRTVDLSNNHVGDYIGDKLGHSLANNSTLELLKVTVLTHHVQVWRGNSTESESLTFTNEMLADKVDFAIVTTLMGVNRSTLILNELHVPTTSDHLDFCYVHITEYVQVKNMTAMVCSYEASFLATRIRHHVYLVNLQLNSCCLSSHAGIQLADALRNHTILEYVSLEHNELGQLGGKAIAECLEHNHRLTYLNLSWNHICNEGTSAFATSLAVNRALRRLDLRGNEIGTQGIVAISSGLATNACLEEIYLRWNDIGPRAAIALAEALTRNKHLRTLDIEQQHMEVEGAIAFGAMLKKNGALTSLNLKSDLVQHPNSSFGVEGTKCLATALNHNKTLMNLNISENRLTPDGIEVFVQVTAQMYLKHLDLSYLHIEGDVGFALFAQLSHNKRLEQLNLEHNNLGPDGLKACVQMLKVNKTLRELNIAYNHITEEGMLIVEKQARYFSLTRLRLAGNLVTETTKFRLQTLSQQLVIDI
ncbi:hypothetical protein THRCLA_21679 [Thraustotheca clavata]|uniref:Proteasome assembly chaperone 2 n=1 Tax=Thraustotheca clavata TaxID=74557 RepID=A0A1V9ZR52_9STRA|nr:hypothetical protein THRCLA_21679 [Thraustotheca clavata]